MSFQMVTNFHKQSALLIELTVLDSAERTINENVKHTIFTWKTSSPTELKNHDLSLVGFFTQSTKRALERYKIVTMLQLATNT